VSERGNTLRAFYIAATVTGLFTLFTLVYLMVLSDYIVRTDTVINEQQIGKMCKKAAVSYFELISRKSAVETEENMKDLNQNRRSRSRIQTWDPLNLKQKH
jgi:hypothetical protein